MDSHFAHHCLCDGNGKPKFGYWPEQWHRNRCLWSSFCWKLFASVRRGLASAAECSELQKQNLLNLQMLIPIPCGAFSHRVLLRHSHFLWKPQWQVLQIPLGRGRMGRRRAGMPDGQPTLSPGHVQGHWRSPCYRVVRWWVSCWLLMSARSDKLWCKASSSNCHGARHLKSTPSIIRCRTFDRRCVTTGHNCRDIQSRQSEDLPWWFPAACKL